MKKLLGVSILFLSVTAFSKDIPTPFWYTISQKILTETQQLILNDKPEKEVVKLKTTKAEKPVRVPLKCEQKKETMIVPFVTVNKNPLWSEPEQ